MGVSGSPTNAGLFLLANLWHTLSLGLQLRSLPKRVTANTCGSTAQRRKVTMVPCLTVLNQHGSTTPSTRLPEALIGRWRGGDSIGTLAVDYGVPAEQIAWGIELAAWRESAVHSPPKKRLDLLRLVSAQLSGFLVFEVRGASGDLVFTTAQKGGEA